MNKKKGEETKEATKEKARLGVKRSPASGFGESKMTIEQQTIEMAESFLTRAGHELEDARTHHSNLHYAESITSSEQCIELSLKAVFLLLEEEYPKRHYFTDDEAEKLLQRVPKELEYYDFPRLFLFSKLWSTFHTVAKYGDEKLGIGAEKLFKKEEADLALHHADKCLLAGKRLYNYIK